MTIDQQVHELRTKLSVCNDKIDDLSKSLRAKTESLESAEQKLETTRMESDSLKIGLDEVRREKLSVQEKLEMLIMEKAAVERSRANLQVRKTIFLKIVRLASWNKGCKLDSKLNSCPELIPDVPRVEEKHIAYTNVLFTLPCVRWENKIFYCCCCELS